MYNKALTYGGYWIPALLKATRAGRLLALPSEYRLCASLSNSL